MKKYYGGIEAGGTKFVCAIGSSPDDVIAETRFSTTTPEETISKAIDFFKRYQDQIILSAIGIASFGPVDLNPSSGTYGYITSTPKPNWSNTSFAYEVKNALNLPVGFDTDVNGALLGEHRWGAAQGLENAIYLTIGTGIGGGVMINGKLVHGLVHPEMGHIILPVREDDPYGGGCPYHGNCLEGLANGPSLEARWGASAKSFAGDHPAWELEAHYLAIALHDFICTFSPQRIILGGGVMKQSQLFPMVREKTLESLNSYVQKEEITLKIDDYIVYPQLGDQAGVLGAIALGQDSLNFLNK